MLALLGVEIEYGEYTQRNYSASIAFSGRIGEKSDTIDSTQQSEKALTPQDVASKAQAPRAPEMRSTGFEGAKPQGLFFANAVPGRIYSRDAFNNDDGPRHSGNKTSPFRQARQNTRTSRRLF
jgi:hypothetical protein